MTDFPNLDPELADAVASIPILDLSDIATARALQHTSTQPALANLSYDGVDVRVVSAAGLGNAPDVPIRLLTPEGAAAPLPVLVAIHGGGFVLGTAQEYEYFCLEVVRELGIAVANVEYRLAPETPFPGPLEDCYAALKYVYTNSDELGLDPSRIAVGGSSAGGGLAAGTILKARDTGEVPVVFQYLISPAIDDRLATPSMTEFVDTPVVNRRTGVLAWQNYLGADYAGPDDPRVSIYAAPGRATDLTGLPPTYIVAMELDPLRDENIEYALRLLRAGVSVELHSHPGTFHGSMELAPSAASSVRAQREVIDALRRGLTPR
ncbi:alpha/beta hydrolase [Saccharopolyspora spinosa]|uniref:Acetyl esterase/lipase n=1 Tax=Saccharopolyspora spinosa TaxID=60894 RepID=A0A2N3XXR7_SACSN|nr:alpha/beta hydrolase [Saccharopolyspora spinosa]PKW15464.1 acetyl esterase/lipase [Saccharopolyspora spinosa]